MDNMLTETDTLLTLARRARRDSIIAQFDFERFMIDSNAIEGETGLNPNDLAAARAFLSIPISEKSLLECHRSLAEHLTVPWAGRYRDCNVRVGDYVAPPFEKVPGLMRQFFRAQRHLDSWKTHCRFEKIHPFRDLNGRTGRLIWLHKALDEGYTGGIGFLHKFYYQTLAHAGLPGKP
jgi:Fic family protein